jgi:uncharacterized protein (TIGR02265 family)
VGRETLRGYTESMIGGAMLIGGKMMGPRRVLLRMADNFQTADNFTRVAVSEPGPDAVDLVITPDGGVPDYFRGLFSEVLIKLGSAAHAVDFEAVPGGTRFHVRWTK